MELLSLELLQKPEEAPCLRWAREAMATAASGSHSFESREDDSGLRPIVLLMDKVLHQLKHPGNQTKSCGACARPYSDLHLRRPIVSLKLQIQTQKSQKHSHRRKSATLNLNAPEHEVVKEAQGTCLEQHPRRHTFPAGLGASKL